ncbi:MAG: radical SAM protein with 4Fe4S-binding SPASM domain [Myxococcota bacterium]|jgi:radical SAM protein with 4Fe4S-binding SPASM domain
MASPRTVTSADIDKPIYAVWELTMRCDHACAHCGSRAGRARPDELSTDEVFDVARALVDLGCREVTLIGGEAYLRPDILEIINFLKSGGLRVTMQTGGRGLTPRLAKTLRGAGMSAIGVSIDGPEAVHDELRAARGSFKAAIGALRAAKAAGMTTTSNCQVNRLNAHLLPETMEAVRAEGIAVWRLQLTVPMGRAADHPEWILQPWQILNVIDTLSGLQLKLAEEAAAAGLSPKSILDIRAGNNIGYYGPHEQVLRSRPGGRAGFWRGCQAGRFTIGIESDGRIKACPSLPSAPYVGGNVRDLSLADIWNNAEPIRFARDRTVEELWGFCKGCYYADLCRGGCSFTAHCTMGKRGNNPLCYHRAATLKKQGKRERLVQAERAPGQPYDFGRFSVIEEDWEDVPSA